MRILNRIVDYHIGISNIFKCGHWFVVNCYCNIVDKLIRVDNCGYSSVSMGCAYGHAKCALKENTAHF